MTYDYYRRDKKSGREEKITLQFACDELREPYPQMNSKSIREGLKNGLIMHSVKGDKYWAEEAM